MRILRNFISFEYHLSKITETLSLIIKSFSDQHLAVAQPGGWGPFSTRQKKRWRKNRKTRKTEKRKIKKLIIYMQQLQYNAPSLVHVFQQFSAADTPGPLFDAVIQNWAPFPPKSWLRAWQIVRCSSQRALFSC